MIQIEQIRNYFPVQIRGNSGFDKHILKEYLQLMILDYLSSTPNIQKMAFIGGTNLRLVKGIERRNSVSGTFRITRGGKR